MIDSYVAELDAVLRGPKHAKADLLAEVRHHLVDASEAHQRNGIGPRAARLRAVREFGEVGEIAPDFQTELGLAQGRRTALLVLFIFLAQPFIWGYAYRWISGTPTEQPRLGHALADSMVEWLGGVTMLLSLVAVAAYGIGVRYLGAHPLIIRATGVFGYAVAAVFGAFSFLLTVLLSPEKAPLPTVIGLLWTTVFTVLPLTVIARSARRCFAMLPRDPAAARPR